MATLYCAGPQQLCLIIVIALLLPCRVDGEGAAMEFVEDCLTEENEQYRRMDLRNLTIGVTKSGIQGFVGTMTIDMETLPLTKIEITKCASKLEVETCKHFSTVRVKDCCKKLDATNEAWSSFFSQTEPPMRCPLKGTYSFEKAVYDRETALKGFPGLEGFYWKAKTTIIDKDKIIGCYAMDLSFI